MPSPITTHVLDTTRGRPAIGVPVALAHLDGARWVELGHGHTDTDGRNRELLSDDHALAPGTYRLVFDTKTYFLSIGVVGFYPKVDVMFELPMPERHYHIALLINPFGYTTYRGS